MKFEASVTPELRERFAFSGQYADVTFSWFLARRRLSAEHTLAAKTSLFYANTAEKFELMRMMRNTAMLIGMAVSLAVAGYCDLSDGQETKMVEAIGSLADHRPERIETNTKAAQSTQPEVKFLLTGRRQDQQEEADQKRKDAKAKTAQGKLHRHPNLKKGVIDAENKAVEEKPIFARMLSIKTGDPVVNVPAYMSGVTGWDNGGTIYRGQLTSGGLSAYDKVTGEPNPAVIAKKLANLKPGSLVSIDIEELGYNGSAQLVGDNQINFLIECRKARPDCKFGYYSSFAGHVNGLIQFNASVRKKTEAAMKLSQRLADHVDFIAPSLYVPYVGPIKDANGVVTDIELAFCDSIHSRWPADSKYGFDEWADWASWKIELCREFGKPVYPYFGPYTIMNDVDGNFSVGNKERGQGKRTVYPVPFFSEAVDHILQQADGLFFFDVSKNRYEPAIEEEIRRVFESKLK